jgi:hypothetical protein
MNWRVPTNWKFAAFSFGGDRTHAAMTHRSAEGSFIGPDGNKGQTTQGILTAPFPGTQKSVGNHNLGHGAYYTFREKPGLPEYVDSWEDPRVDDYYRQTHALKAKKFADTILPGLGHTGSHFGIFPNVILNWWRILIFHPHGVGETESVRLFQVDKNAPQYVKDAQRHWAMRICGPAGLVESDDHENWNYAFPASLGTMAQKLPYNFAANLGRGHEDERLPGFMIGPTAVSEEPARARFSRWLAFMEAKSWDDLYPIKKDANHQLFP